jgi:hypothetical protein
VMVGAIGGHSLCNISCNAHEDCAPISAQDVPRMWSCGPDHYCRPGCVDNNQCGSGQVCGMGRCGSPKGHACMFDTDCTGGLSCDPALNLCQ